MNDPTSDELSRLHQRIAGELQLPIRGVTAAATLLADGNTIPFIARYRKEATGGLDEIELRAIEDTIEKAAALASRKATVIKSIDEQGLMTPVLLASINACGDLHSLEEIYLPFKPKRRTRASIARERGLQPLADWMLAQRGGRVSRGDVLRPFIDPAKDVPDVDAAIAGALDIVTSQWSEDAEVRRWMVDKAMRFGQITSTVKRGKKDEATKFEQYLDHRESAGRVAGHRLLAMLRGQSEGVLKVGLAMEDDRAISHLRSKFVTNPSFEFHRELVAAVEDCFQRLLHPATESTVLQVLRERAEAEAIDVFGKNLQEVLMAPPAGPRVTIGIDPGFRTGCKVAVVDGTGKLLQHTTIYPTPPKSDTTSSRRTLLELIRRHGVELIAIGNGTASRETDAFAGDLIRDEKLDVTKVMVSESGASIYSASEIAAKEFPDLDLTVRGAISIARRLQDPLAELVKTDPKSIGVGQYQHDVNQSNLRKCLERTVQSCVNRVGVDVNMASAALLAHVAGIGEKLAENIVEHRNQNGRFADRGELMKVSKLGKKAFEQAAGFLRIRDGRQPLDNSAVHPESYSLVDAMARELVCDVATLVGNAGLSQKLTPDRFANDRFGIPTVIDIIAELAKPGRDPRREFKLVRFDESVQSIDDVRSGMVLEGVITNVTHFGAFVDLGVHQDGLIHVSQLADQFVSDPNEIVAVGDVVKIKVVEVDLPRKRIALTRKF